MYYFGKILQAIGLTIVGIDFVRKFPKLMDTKILGFGIFFFAIGWIILRFLVRTRA